MKTCQPVQNSCSRSPFAFALGVLLTVAVLLQCPTHASAAPGLATQPASMSSFALDVNGKLYSWGMNQTYGQLGLGNTTNVLVPVAEPLPADATNWVAVAGGANHTLFLAN